VLAVRLAASEEEIPAAALALPVVPGPAIPNPPDELAADCQALLEMTGHTGRAGAVQNLPRPRATPHRVLLAGIGDGGEAGWRAAGAALARAAVRETGLTVRVPVGTDPAAVRGLAEGLLLASYRFRLGADPPEKAPRLRRVALAVADPERYAEAVATAAAVAEATGLARDLTNTPALRKTPAWFVRQVEKAASEPGLRLRVWREPELRAGGFGGILAVGGGSANPPQLLQLSWRPPRTGRHVVLVGKGVTFDTGGVSIKNAAQMKLMRKDMAGAAAVVAATLGAARLRLPVRVTALAPLVENMPSGAAARPGDVIRHWGGKTTEARNTDAEGRLVLADALAYAAARLRPDVLVDVATLTGATAVALGKRTAAVYSDDPELAAALGAAATAAGEQVWRMPLVTDYRAELRSDLADQVNYVAEPGAGSVLAALFLHEFTGDAGGRWAHIDMSAPAWSDKDDAELSRGATGWGVRTLLRWLISI
jgi:leucyl aminopeptidase